MKKLDMPLSIDVVYFKPLRLITYIVLAFYKFERKGQQILTSFIKLKISSTYSMYFVLQRLFVWCGFFYSEKNLTAQKMVRLIE